MKKLMSLMVLAAAAFAGGGMLNEHNLTTAVNYLYHKQQVGSVISLGSITNTPPAALPAHLPNVPGAIPQASTSPPPADPQPGLPPAPPAAQLNTAPVTVASSVSPVSAMPVPATPPPPLSIHWPDQTTSSYSTSPKPDASAAPAISATTPPVASSANVGDSRTPSVPPPIIASSDLSTSSPKLDSSVGSAGFASAKLSDSSATQPSWPDLMRKMQSLGIRNIHLNGTPGGRLKLECEMASINGSKPQTIEGEGETPQAAAQVALKRIVLFNAARRASRNSSQRASTTAPSSSPIPQFSPITPPESVPPAPSLSNEPLAPPADVPN